MTKLLYLLVLLFFFIPVAVYAQKKKAGHKFAVPNSAQQWEQADKLSDREYQCFNNNRYNADQRMVFFPFKNANSIRLVSFADTNKIYTPLSVNNFAIHDSEVIESKLLSKKAIDSLTHILYNIGRTPVKNLIITVADPGAKCYEPRNAILFTNSNGVVTQYIELCFSCDKYYFSSSKIRPMPSCEQKFDMLKAFFLSQGIKFGTVLPKRDEE